MGDKPDAHGDEHEPQRPWPAFIGYSEIDKYAIQIYQNNFPDHKNYGDITKIEPAAIPDFDLFCGGFPCQAFSIAGKRRGFEDTRGTLFFEIARILKVKRPRLLLLENVKGLLSHDEGRTFKTILSALDELGYELQWQVLNSKNFGVPQNRERVFIVGNLGGTPRPKVFPFGENSEADIVLPTLTARYWGAQANGGYIGEKQKESDLKYIGAIMSEKNKKRLEDGKLLSRNFPQGQRVYGVDGVSSTLASQAGGLGGKTGLYAVSRQPLKFLQRNQKNIEGDYAFTVDASQTSGVRIEPYIQNPKMMNFKKDFENSVAITATSYKEPPVVSGIRRLTPLECERLQGFPDGWTLGISDTQRYKCLGNAVTVNVIRAIAGKLIA